MAIKSKSLRNFLAVRFVNAYSQFDAGKSHLDEGRKRFENLSSIGRKIRIAKIRDYTVSGTQVREYTNHNNAPYMIFLHGGGYVLGSIKSHDTMCRRIVKYCNVNIISVEYSCAPEAKYPVQINQVRKIIEYTIKKHGPRILIAGDSAGGTFAAALSPEFKEIVLQILFYPLLDLRLINQSIIKNGVTNNWLTAAMLDWFVEQYLHPDDPKNDPLVSPIFSDPNIKTMIITGTRDPLHDDALNYAKKLENNGVIHELYIAPSTLHGFVQFPVMFGYKKALKRVSKFITANL